VFVIGPDEKVKLVPIYPMTTGRTIDELIGRHPSTSAPHGKPKET
jgi:alkyl hydroperoxide reductase subunit AhpC